MDGGADLISVDNGKHCVDVKDYDTANGKLSASLRWLVARIYEEADPPDILRQLFHKDDAGVLHPLPAVVAGLVNGDFYKQAASRIFHDGALVNATIGAVLRMLSSAGIEVREADGTHVTETALVSDNPLRVQSHLALIDGLMAAHIKNLISIERVVKAISVYTPVDQKEEPLDCIDALLFWVNKICLLVRDDVERSGVVLTSHGQQAETTIPEMEDLYEDLCDGTCVCTVLSFYRPDAVPLQGIYFNDPMSINDCRYNLSILKAFCEHSLPWSPFHFELEDLLYLHESLQPNVNVFLADLFHFLETSNGEASPPESSASVTPVQRRFVPVEGIPELRSRNLAARPAHPPPKINRYSLASSSRADRGDRATSVASMDSLMTSSGDSLMKYSTMPKAFNLAGVTSFGQLQPGGLAANHEHASGIDQHVPPHHKSSLEIRLQMEELRRQWERNKQLQSALSEEKRNKAGKDAFFRVMSKSTHGDAAQKENTDGSPQLAAENESLNAQVRSLQEQINELKLASQLNLAQPQPTQQTVQSPYYANVPSHSTSNLNLSGISAQFPAVQPAGGAMPSQAVLMNYGAAPGAAYPGVMQGSQQPQSMAYPPMAVTPLGQQQALPQQFPFSTPPYYQQPNQLTPQMFYTPQQQQLLSQQLYHTPPQHQQFGSTATGIFQPPQQSQMQSMTNLAWAPNELHPQQLTGIQHIPPVLSPSMSNHDGFNSSTNTNSAFWLHQPDASSSRLDPQLELNRNLTNWGLTYRAGDKPPRKTWANRAETTPNGKGPAPDVTGSPTLTNSTDGAGGSDNSAKGATIVQSTPPMLCDSQARRDRLDDSDLIKSAPGGILLIPDATEDSAEMTLEMQAKKRALLASQMRRKEKNAALSEEKEAIELMKRKEEMEKQELGEQRKFEREMRRQKLLEDYKRRKMEQDLGDMSPTGHSARFGSTTSLNRGHSQPPSHRPKSQSNMGMIQSRTLQRKPRAQSNFGDDEQGTPRIHVPSTAEPTLRLFAKQQPKSNRSLIMNAIQYSIFPGSVSSEHKMKALAALAQSDSKHFLVLFRDNKCQYRGLYSWDQIGDTAFRIDGTGPKVCRESMMCFMFKYDSGSKAFSIIPTRHLSVTIDGFAVADQYWQKPKMPHSSART